MRSIVRYFIVVLLAAVTLGLGGCDKQKEKREKPPKLDVVSVDKLSGSMVGDCFLTLTIANNTAFKVTITSGELAIKYGGRKIGQVASRGGFTLPPRKHTQVTLPLRVSLASSLNALSAANSIRQGKLEKITIDYKVVAKILSSEFTISEENLTLEDLNKELNLGLKK